AFNKDKEGRDWGVPVLYMRAANGQLFEGAADKSARDRARESAEADVNVRVNNVQTGGVVTGAEVSRMLSGRLAVNVTVTGTVLGEVVGMKVDRLHGGSANVRAEAETVGPGGSLTGLRVGSLSAALRDLYGETDDPADAIDAQTRHVGRPAED
ncbi:hypothetical protein, partial [Terrabacter sp. Soil810]|uniref:hypothetical protein n=1 Tax=Terrabacter sp. Soil810 TaxID=1736418 RepID=UPI00070F7287